MLQFHGVTPSLESLPKKIIAKEVFMLTDHHTGLHAGPR